MRTGCIIQARMTSTRLPGKVALKLPFNSEITVLGQVIRRVLKAKNIDEVIIATTVNSSDDEIVEIAKKEDVKYYRGSEDDVLSRYYFAAKENSLDNIVRITSDCPCMDFNILDRLIEKKKAEKLDYCDLTNFPKGIEAEVFSYSLIEEAYENASEKYEREHVTPYIYMTKKDKFKIDEIVSGKDLTNIRVTLDTKEDYTLLCAVYDELYKENNFFEIDDIIELFKEKEWLYNINEKTEQKKIYETYEEEKTEAIKILKLKGMERVIEKIEG